MSEPLVITITHDPAYRSLLWTEGETRPGWLVSCPAHPKLGKDGAGEAWGYESLSRARQVASKHGNAKHPNAYEVTS
jgi:hypothetical protein